MTFAWSPDGQNLAYSRPDGIGLVDINGLQLTTLVGITPLNTHSDWAWTPGIVWASDNENLYFVTHAAPSGLVSPEESPNFNLATVSQSNDQEKTIVQQTGMFANPSASSSGQGEIGSSFKVAYLQAIFPTQSKTSRYQLEIMDSDGANQRVLFPAEGQTGLQPQTPVWSPEPLDSGAYLISVIYEGNLWIIDTVSSLAQQITGDGLTSQVDWK
jgi:hypothetical protein